MTNIETARTARELYNSSPNSCLTCDRQILHVAGRLRDTTSKKFCNASCAAKTNNPKRRKQNHCSGCNSVISKASERCRTCSSRARPVELDSTTKSDLFGRRRNWQSARSSIRENARKVYVRSDKPLECIVCGYSKHVEIAHRRPVSDFSGDALVSEINSIGNLMPLCPTHHWEFDNLPDSEKNPLLHLTGCDTISS